MTVGLNLGGGITLTPNGMEYGIPIGSGLAIAITRNNDPSPAPAPQHATSSTSWSSSPAPNAVATQAAKDRIGEGNSAAKIAALGCIALGSICLARIVQTSLRKRAKAWGASPAQAKWMGILGGILTAGAGMGAATYVWNKY